MRSIKFALIVFILLMFLGGFMAWKLVTAQEPAVETVKPAEPPKTRIVARQDLQAFTLLTEGFVEVRKSSTDLNQNAPKVEDLTGRYLLDNVKKGSEIKDGMLAPRDAKSILDNAVAVSVPASPTTLLGGQLRVGDLVDLVAVPSRANTGAKMFKKLLVLNITQPNKDANLPAAIILAVPRTQGDKLASAVAGAQLVVTRKIVAYK